MVWRLGVVDEDGAREVEILAVHVGCAACGMTARIDQPQHADAFTQHVLEPIYRFWLGHMEPRIGMFELIVDGEYAEWEAVNPGGVDF